MNISDQGLEVYVYNRNCLSIKDLRSDIDISDSKWNSIFHDFINYSNSIYFWGERLEVRSNNLERDLVFITDRFIDNDNYYSVFVKIKWASISINRSILSKVWTHYEYPAIIFLTSDQDEQELIKFYFDSRSYEEIVGSIDQIYIIHRNFEPNVLWIKKGDDMPSVVF